MSLLSRFASLPALALALPLAVSAESVDFDEMEAMDDPGMTVSEEYADLGLHFQLAGAIWSGTSEGDPGGWGLEGTRGPSFLGIDAPVFNMVMRFDWPVGALSFDIAPSTSGSGQLLVFGYRNNSFVEMKSVPYGAPGQWKRVEMTQDVDIIVALGIGAVAYGVDGMHWVGPLGDGPTEMEVALDIKPDSADNPVQVSGKGVIPMAILGDEMIDVLRIDASTILFGPGGAMPAHAGGHVEDVDDDGMLDLVLHMPTMDSGLASDAQDACLEGMMMDGTPFYGCDKVTPVGNGKK